MRISSIFSGSLILIFILMVTPVPASGAEVEGIRSDAAGVTIDVTVQDYKVSEKVVGSHRYDRVDIPDLGESKDIGRPQVPIRGTLIGIPENGKVTLKATGFDYHSFHLKRDLAPALHPSGKMTNQPSDDKTYKTNAFYPGPLATEGFTGYMRDQKVMQILFYPVQYNPVTREVRVYKRIRAEVTFEEPISNLSKKLLRNGEGTVKDPTVKVPAGGTSNAYEKLLKDSLLNYDSLQR